MRRREFIAGFAGAAVAWMRAACAQQSGMPVIGFLHTGERDLYAGRVRAFRQGLSEIGYVEGRNVTIEYRWSGDQIDRLPTLAADLVRRQVSVLVANSPAARAAKVVTETIPIIFVTGLDPVENGLVAGLARPGGNLTGAANLSVELGPKRLELLHELIPKASIIAVLINPNNATANTQSRDLQAAARTLGLQLHVVHASNERQFDAVFATLVQLRAGGLLIGTDSLFINRVAQLGALSVLHAMPTIFQFREFAAAGGLMSYGASFTDPFRIVGGYAGRILKGEKPADLPVQLSTKVDLIINMKTAKTLGLSIPETLLATADEVIE